MAMRILNYPPTARVGTPVYPSPRYQFSGKRHHDAIKIKQSILLVLLIPRLRVLFPGSISVDVVSGDRSWCVRGDGHHAGREPLIVSSSARRTARCQAGSLGNPAGRVTGGRRSRTGSSGEGFDRYRRRRCRSVGRGRDAPDLAAALGFAGCKGRSPYGQRRSRDVDPRGIAQSFRQGRDTRSRVGLAREGVATLQEPA